MLNEILNKVNFNDSNIELKKKFFEDVNIKKYILGKNNESLILVKNYKIDGIIDDYATESQTWNAIPLIKMIDVNKDSIIINCSTSISPNSVLRKLKSLGFFNVINYFELANSNNNLPFPSFVLEMRQSIKGRKTEWENLISLMDDVTSKNTLSDIIKYRLTGNPEFMRSYSIRLNEQYMESFMNYKNEILADIGGYDGDTSKEFCTRFMDYKKIFFFEPSKINIKKAKENLAPYSNIYYYNLGLSDKNQALFFNSENGSACSISTNGPEKIEVVKLDDQILEPVSLIKMDIEGWEKKALLGSEKQIRANSPKMAIAVYHSADDFLDIPKIILGINPNYKIRLRHYTEGWSETVMYFMPVINL